MHYACPKDNAHQSDDPDYCSICGAKIGGAAVRPAAPFTPGPNGAAGGAEACPDCGLPRHAGAKFCEVCRYNFEARSSAAPPPAVTAAPVPDQAPASSPAIAPAAGAIHGWEAVVAVDPSLYDDPDPQVPCPTGEPERTFPLDLAECLIGRRSDRRDIHPEVQLSDSGVSHRHAKILRRQDGGLALLDVGSTNGTQLNGAEVPAGVHTPLADGDQITVGCWTRITIRAQKGN